MSMMSSYTPIANIFKGILRRQLLTAFESITPTPKLKQEDLDKLMSCLKSLPPRKNLVACIQLLRENGFDVFAMTNGGQETSKGSSILYSSRHLADHSNLGYYKQAHPGDPSSVENFMGDLDKQVVSCDEIKIAKPKYVAYIHLRTSLTFFCQFDGVPIHQEKS